MYHRALAYLQEAGFYGATGSFGRKFLIIQGGYGRQPKHLLSQITCQSSPAQSELEHPPSDEFGGHEAEKRRYEH